MFYVRPVYAKFSRLSEKTKCWGFAPRLKTTDLNSNIMKQNTVLYE